MSNETESENVVPFRLTFGLDRDNFFRRACPSCGRDFKTQIDEADLVASLQPVIRRMGVEIGETPEERKDREKEYLYCPYCEHHTESSDMLTPTFIAYLKRHLMREYVMPMVNKMLSNVADSFGGASRGRTGGMFSIEVNFEHNRPVLPPRPISGPEPPDMTIVEFLCCGKKVKVFDGWYSISLCPYCGTEVSIQ